jgi:hypothetical protein
MKTLVAYWKKVMRMSKKKFKKLMMRIKILRSALTLEMVKLKK